MKTLATLGLILLAMISAYAEPLGDRFDFSKVTSVDVAFELRDGADLGLRYFKPLATSYSTKKRVAEILKAVAGSQLEAPGRAPFALVGDLCHLIFRDADATPVFLVTVVNWDNVCEIRRARSDKEGRVVLAGGKDVFGFVSPVLVRKIYTDLLQIEPDYVRKIIGETPRVEFEEQLLSKSGER